MEKEKNAVPEDLMRMVRGLELFNIMGKNIIFDPVTLCCIEADEVASKTLSSGKSFLEAHPSCTDSELIACLLHNGETQSREFLADLAVLQRQGKILAHEEEPADLSPEPPLNYAILNVSHACNMQCRYCFADHGTYGDAPSLMTEDTAKRAIDFLLPQFHKDFMSIGFFGGEPLLDFPVIRSVVEYCREQAEQTGRKCKFHLTTNGVLLSGEVIDFLGKHDFTMIVSVDGPESLHDSMRRSRGDKGTHGVILRNLVPIRGTRLALRTTLRSTYTAENPAVLERFLFLRDLCKDGYAYDFSIEPSDLPDGSPLAFKRENLESVKREDEAVALIYLKSLNDGEHIRLFHFDRIARKLVGSQKTNTFCDAGKGYVTISPKGDIYACHKEGPTRIGSLDDGFDPALRTQWLTNTAFCKKPCPNCWARHICAGECRYDALEYMGDAATPFWMGCELRQHWIKLCMWIASELSEKGKATLMGNRGEREKEQGERRKGKSHH